MPTQESIRENLLFRLLPENQQETITDRKRALNLIAYVAEKHKSEPVMTDYKIFEEEMRLAYLALEYWEGERKHFPKREREAFEYLIRTKPKS